MARRQFQFCAFALFALALGHLSLLPSHAQSADAHSKPDSTVATAPSSSTEIMKGDRVVITADDAPLILGDKLLATLTKGTAFTVLKAHDKWVGVTHRVNGKEIGGWIHRSYLTTTERPRNAPPQVNHLRTLADPVTNIAHGEIVRVISDDASLLLGKNRVATLTKGTELTVLKAHGNWVGVAHQVDGKEIGGWIHQRHLNTTERPRNAPPQVNHLRTLADPATNGAPEDIPVIGEAAKLAHEERVKESIERVLAAVQDAYGEGNSAVHVVERMRAINWTGCPNDFKSAYLAHIHAWEMLAEVEADAIALKVANQSVGTYIEAFFRGAAGDPFGKAIEMHAAHKELQRKHRTAKQQIKATFDRVEEIAVLHGVNLPPNSTALQP